MKVSRADKYFIVAGVAGFIAAVLAGIYFIGHRSSSADSAGAIAQPDRAGIVIAAEKIAPRSVISESMVCLKPVAKEQIPEGCFTRTEDVIGRVATAQIGKDELITVSKVAPISSALGLAFIVPRGMRAVSVQVNEVTGVAGFIMPGDRVDVLATFEWGTAPGSQVQNTVTRIILQDVQVLAAGPQMASEEAAAGGVRQQPASTVTLAVTPSQAERLALLEARARVKLALRRAGDSSAAFTRGTSSASLFGLPGPVKATVKAPTLTAGQRGTAAKKGQRIMEMLFPTAPPSLPPIFETAGTSSIPEREATAAAQLRPVKVIEVFRGTQKESVSIETK